jgi:hypothetical protein
MNVSSQQTPAPKEQKLILQDPMENIMKFPQMNQLEDNRDNGIHFKNQDEVLEDDGQGQGQGEDNNFKSRKLNSLAEGEIMQDAIINIGFLPWEKKGTLNNLQKVSIDILYFETLEIFWY